MAIAMVLHAINQAAPATAFCERFFGFAEIALAPSPALVKATGNSGKHAICGSGRCVAGVAGICCHSPSGKWNLHPRNLLIAL
jgi:hypothetical protein